MFPNRQAMLASIASIDCQIQSFKRSIENLRAQKKTYSAMHSEAGRNAAKNIQFDIEQKMRQVKYLQEQKKSMRAMGYQK